MLKERNQAAILCRLVTLLQLLVTLCHQCPWRPQVGNSLNLQHIYLSYYPNLKYTTPHVLAHFVKSFRAYNVKLSSTLFLGNMLSNFEISFPNARFLIQLGYNLITISWDYQEWDFSDPSIIKSKKHSFKCVVLLWKTLIRVSIEF